MHIEGYISVVTLAGVIWVIAEFRLMKWKHERMWADYEKRHGMNGLGHELKQEVARGA